MILFFYAIRSHFFFTAFFKNAAKTPAEGKNYSDSSGWKPASKRQEFGVHYRERPGRAPVRPSVKSGEECVSAARRRGLMSAWTRTAAAAASSRRCTPSRGGWRRPAAARWTRSPRRRRPRSSYSVSGGEERGLGRAPSGPKKHQTLMGFFF